MANFNVGQEGLTLPPRGDKDVKQLIRERVAYTVSKYSGYYETLRKFHRYYLSANERRRRKEPDRDDGAVNWKANLFIPYSFSTIETAVPRLVFSLFGSRPYVQVAGRTQDDHAKAKAVESMLDYDFEQAGVLFKSVLAFKSLYKYGITIGKVTWKRDYYHKKRTGFTTQYDWGPSGEITGARTKKVTTTELVERYEGPWFNPVSVFNFFPDPMYWDIGEMRYCAEYEMSDIRKLRRENEIHKELTGKELYTGLDNVKPLRKGMLVEDMPRKSQDETAQVFGYSYTAQRRDMAEQNTQDMVELVHYWENDRYVVLANGDYVILDSENPFSDQTKPYFAATCFPVEYEFYGLGLLHPTADLQEEMNSWRNMVLDQGKLNMMNIWAVDEASPIEGSDLALFPGKIVRTRIMGGRADVVPLLDQRSLPPESQWIEGQIQRDWQTALAINDYLIGAGSGSAGTASEAAMLNASAATRFRLQALIGEERYMGNLSRMFFSRRQQFFDEDRVFRILGKDGYEFPRVSQEDLNGNFDFIPVGTQSQPNKEVLRQQLSQLIAVLAGNPILAGMTDFYEVMRQWWTTFDVRHPDRFIIPPPDKVIPPEHENYILLKGEHVPVTANEPHDKHLQVHMQAMGQAQDERAFEALNDHIAEHNKFKEFAAPALPGGPAGVPGGAPGNQPGASPENNPIPTLPAQQAQAQGGPGGVIA